jgi:tRNA/tmRNA/rRNA uracil-C5-methylase (TrmA/RlmC/RlmD family)
VDLAVAGSNPVGRPSSVFKHNLSFAIMDIAPRSGVMEASLIQSDQDARFLLHVGQILELGIENITNEGAGVARYKGIVIFIPFTLIGETIRACLTRVHKHYAEGVIESLLRSSPNRITPECRYFTKCGGCQYQHIRYETQLIYKRTQIVELLGKMVNIENPQSYVQPTVPSPKIYGYRTKLTPHFTMPRKSSHSDRQPPLGFLERGSRHHVIDIEHCPIATEKVNQGLQEQRSLFAKQWPRYKRSATLLIRESQEGILTDPRATATQIVSGATFRFPAGDFFQNNASILETFVDHIIRESKGVEYLVDAYCGSGLFSLCAAPYFREIYGIEISPAAVARAQENIRLNNAQHIHIVAGDAASIFSALKIKGENSTLIIDPPRRGCDQGFLEQCTAFAPARIVYVSCYPSTQMRDLKILLTRGYQLHQITPFDLFPQTKHVETVMTLIRKRDFLR